MRTTTFSLVKLLKAINGVLAVVLLVVIAFVVTSKGELEAAPLTLAEAQMVLNNSISQTQNSTSVINYAAFVNDANFRIAIDIAVGNTTRAGGVRRPDPDKRKDVVNIILTSISNQGSLLIDDLKMIVAVETQKTFSLYGNTLGELAASISDDTARLISSAAQAAAQLVAATNRLQLAILAMQNLQGSFAALISPTSAQIQSYITKITNIQGFSNAISSAASQVSQAATAISQELFDLTAIAYDVVQQTFGTAASQLFGIIGDANGIIGGGTSSFGGSPGGIPFGGLSTYVFYCTCSGGIAVYINDLTISPPVRLPLIFRPGTTTLYPYGQIYRAGVWTLGLWRPGGVCTYWAGKSCATLPTAGTMRMVGTSM